jgi:ubiquinone/menaquinone biosynthesis C-methylase UbiE
MVNEKRTFKLPAQVVTLCDFPTDGLILDIGGGGEGVIGQIKGSKVVAIDMLSRELAEAPAGPLKIIMDARDLKFLSCTFPTVTAFFSFMFIHPYDHARVFHEIYRVLVPKGQLMLWDVEIPQRTEPERDMLVFPLQVHLPSTVIDTGYGTPYTEKTVKVEDYITLAARCGFQMMECDRAGQTFFCKFQKP